MERLGFPWKRITVAQIEGARLRSFASVEELLGLAHVLNVPVTEIISSSAPRGALPPPGSLAEVRIARAKLKRHLEASKTGIEITARWRLRPADIEAILATGSPAVDATYVSLIQRLKRAEADKQRARHESAAAVSRLNDLDREIEEIQKVIDQHTSAMRQEIDRRIAALRPLSDTQEGWLREKFTSELDSQLTGQPETEQFRIEETVGRDLRIDTNEVIALSVQRWGAPIAVAAEERTEERLREEYGSPDDVGWSATDLQWGPEPDEYEANRRHWLLEEISGRETALKKELTHMPLDLIDSDVRVADAMRIARGLWGHSPAAEQRARELKVKAESGAITHKQCHEIEEAIANEIRWRREEELKEEAARPIRERLLGEFPGVGETEVDWQIKNELASATEVGDLYELLASKFRAEQEEEDEDEEEE